MPTLITIVEPAGLSLAPELAIALARVRRQATRRRMVLADLDVTGRLLELLRAEEPVHTALSQAEPTLSDGLFALAVEPFQAQAPGRVRTRVGEYLRGGARLEEAWRQIENTALATGHALSVTGRLRDLLFDPDGREVIALAPLGMGPITLGLVAASDAVVMVVPEGADAATVDLAQRWIQRIGMARSDGVLRLLARTVTAPQEDVEAETGPRFIRQLHRRIASSPAFRFESPPTGVGSVTPWLMVRGAHSLSSAMRLWGHLGEAGI